MTDYDHGYSNGYQQARADMHDHVEPMTDVADRYAHRLAMHLELFLSDYGGKYYTDALNTLGEYRSAMNRIHDVLNGIYVDDVAGIVNRALAANTPLSNQEVSE